MSQAPKASQIQRFQMRRDDGYHKNLFMTAHAKRRISERFPGWNEVDIHRLGNEVCRKYFLEHKNERRAEISLSDSKWVVKRSGRNKAIIKTVIRESFRHVTHRIEDFAIIQQL